MSKVTKKQRINQIADQLARQQGVISKLSIMVKEQNEAILMLEKLTDEKLRDQPELQLKQLTQSIFDGLDEKWRFAAVDADGSANGFDIRVYPCGGDEYGLFAYESDYANSDDNSVHIGKGYDTSNWQNSLIERDDIAKELLEVDLSSELTGSDLAVKYFESNERHICFVGEDNDGCLSDLMIAMVVGYNEYRGFMTSYNDWFPFVILINNQGEPLTASEVGL